MTPLDQLWREVIEQPRDLAPRLVLADALLEAGDPRGELFTLQCRGADASVIVDGTEAAESAAEQINELVAAHWDAWLGDAALVLDRMGSRFRDGMLWSITVDAERALGDAAWTAAARHRELAAVREIRVKRARAEPYARFLISLANAPDRVQLRPGDGMALVRHGATLAVREIRFSGESFYSKAFGPELALLPRVLPTLESLDLGPVGFTTEQRQHVADTIASLPRWFPGLTALRIERGRFLDEFDDRQRAQVLATPLLELR